MSHFLLALHREGICNATGRVRPSHMTSDKVYEAHMGRSNVVGDNNRMISDFNKNF